MEKDKNLREHLKDILQEHGKIPYAVALILFLLTLLIPILFENINDISKDDVEKLTVFFSSKAFVFVGIIIIASLLIYGLIDLFLDKTETKTILKKLNAQITVLDRMLATKGLNRIVTDEAVSLEEKESLEIIVITEDLLTDIHKSYKKEYENNESVGMFYDAVSANMIKGKQYTYCIRLDSNTYKTIRDHMESHFNRLKKEGHENIVEPKFILIPAVNFYFFSQVVLYKDRKKAYEWLPSIKTETDDHDYYLELSDAQTESLKKIVQNLEHEYGYVRGNSLVNTAEQIVDDIYINDVECNAKKITVITEDLSKDLEFAKFGESIINNLKSGKSYDYILPNNSQIRSQLEQYKSLYEELISENQMNIFLVASDMFFFFSDIFIYDQEDGGRLAFEFIPTSNMYFRHEAGQEKKLVNNLNVLKLDKRTERYSIKGTSTDDNFFLISLEKERKAAENFENR